MSVDVSVCLPVCLDSRMVTCNVGGRSAGRSEFRTDRWISRVDGWVDRLLRYQIGFFHLVTWLACLVGCVSNSEAASLVVTLLWMLQIAYRQLTPTPLQFVSRGRYFILAVSFVQNRFNSIQFHSISSTLHVCAWLVIVLGYRV